MGQIVIESDCFVRDEKCTLNSNTLNTFVTIKSPPCWLMKAQHLATRWKVKWRSIFSGKVEDSLSTQTIFQLNVSPFSPIRDMINNAMFLFFSRRGEFTWYHHPAMLKSIMFLFFSPPFHNLLKAAVNLFENMVTLFFPPIKQIFLVNHTAI